MRRFALIVVFFLASGAARGAEPPASRASGDSAIQARHILNRYCAACHTGSSAPGFSKLNVLEHKQLIAKGPPVPFVAPGGGRSQVLELLKDGSMPPANRPAPMPAEVAVLERWIQVGAPPFPPAFDERFVLQTVADDLDRQQAKSKNRDPASTLRYASFAHLIRDGKPLPDLAEAESRLNAALSAAAGHPVTVEPVDSTATVFRIDLAKLGWWTRELFEKIERRRPTGAHPLRPFDLLLLEYPHAERLPSGDPLAARLETFLDARNQSRPVAYLRADWLTAALLNGKTLTPLASDIKSLAALEKAFAQAQPAPAGPPVPRVLATAKPFVAPSDGRVPLPPLSGWYAGDVASEPVPFTLTAELVADSQPVKQVKVDQRFKLRVQSDRRVYVTLLMVQSDGEVRIQELAGGSVLQPNAARELAPGPDGFSISGIITGGDSATEYFVLFAVESELPLPVIVRSLHADRPVWRFLLEASAEASFNTRSVVRKVVPIPVSRK